MSIASFLSYNFTRLSIAQYEHFNNDFKIILNYEFNLQLLWIL